MGALLLFLLVSVIPYISFERALAFKGCTIPRISYNLGRSFIMIDALTKMMLYPLFDEVDSYLITCVYVIFALMFFIIFRINWDLNRKSIRVLKKYPAEENYTILGLRILLWHLAIIIFNAIIILKGWKWEDTTEIIAIVIYASFFALFITICLFLTYVRLDRIKIPALRSLASLRSNKAPIVLLRSFKLDSIPYWNNKTFDEMICENLDLSDNPIISLADPDQILPTGGSLKIQTKDEYWKTVAEEIICNCRAIILVEGDSEGLSWEVDKVRKIYANEPGKVFIMVPPNKYRYLAYCVENQKAGIIQNFPASISKLFSPLKTKKVLNSVWEAFAAYMTKQGYNLPQSFPGDNCILGFDSKWNPRPILKVHESKDLFSAFLKTIPDVPSRTFDYGNLAQKIADFEVNGFMSQETVVYYKNEVIRLHKFEKRVICFFAALTVVVWSLFIYS